MAKTNYAKQLQLKSADVINRSFERFDTALDEARARKYSADKALSDSIAGWVEVMKLAWFPWSLVSDLERKIEFEVKKGGKEATQVVGIPSIFDAPVKVSSKLKHQNGKDALDGKYLHPELSVDGEHLIVRIDALPSRAAIPPGRYRGDVYDANGDTVAPLIVRVS